MNMKKVKEITNVEIVLYALYLLGGNTDKVFTEDIALKSFELSSRRFSWRRHSEYPDLESVRIALFDAQKKKVGSLVVGRHGKATGSKVSDGWIFTPEGIVWLEKNKIRIGRILKAGEAVVNRTEVDKKISEYKNTTAYKKFSQGHTCYGVEAHEFTDFLDASLDTPATILRERMHKIRALATTQKQKDLIQFLDSCNEHFADLLNK